MQVSGATMIDDAEIRAKVLTLDSDVVELKGSVENLGKRLVISHDQLSAKIDSQGEKLYAKIDTIFQQTQAGRQTQWSVVYAGIGVLMTFCITVGGLAYWPIKSAIEKSDVQLAELGKTLNTFMLNASDRLVNTNTFEGFAARVNTSVQNIRGDMAGLPEKFVGWREYDRLLGEVRDAKASYLLREVYETRLRDIDRRIDGSIRRLERVESETMKSQ